MLMLFSTRQWKMNETHDILTTLCNNYMWIVFSFTNKPNRWLFTRYFFLSTLGTSILIYNISKGLDETLSPKIQSFIHNMAIIDSIAHLYDFRHPLTPIDKIYIKAQKRTTKKKRIKCGKAKRYHRAPSCCLSW